MNKLFDDGSQTVTFDGKYNSKIEYAVNDFKASLKFQHDAFLSKGNNYNKLYLPILIIAVLYGLGLFFSYKTSYSDVHLGTGIPLGAAALFFGIFISIYFERSTVVKVLFALISVGLVLILFTLFSLDTTRSENLGFYASYGFLIFGFISIILFQYLIKQPTPEKLETQSLIEGFKCTWERQKKKHYNFIIHQQ